jgi:hypothetical protein
MTDDRESPRTRGPRHPHPSLREWLTRLVGPRDAPTAAEDADLEPSRDPVLVAFAQLFADSGLFAFAANKRLRPDALTLVYDCWTESMRHRGDGPDTFAVAWAPNRQGRDPLTGFRTGEDSILLGTAPTVAMPQDGRTDALLLLVTSRFVHLSGHRGGPEPSVRGVLDDGGDRYRFLALEPGAALVDDAPS